MISNWPADVVGAQNGVNEGADRLRFTFIITIPSVGDVARFKKYFAPPIEDLKQNEIKVFSRLDLE